MNLTEVVDVNKHSELNRIGNEFDVRIGKGGNMRNWMGFAKGLDLI